MLERSFVYEVALRPAWGRDVPTLFPLLSLKKLDRDDAAASNICVGVLLRANIGRSQSAISSNRTFLSLADW